MRILSLSLVGLLVVAAIVLFVNDALRPIYSFARTQEKIDRAVDARESHGYATVENAIHGPSPSPPSIQSNALLWLRIQLLKIKQRANSTAETSTGSQIATGRQVTGTAAPTAQPDRGWFALSDPRTVTLTQSISITLPYGVADLWKGTKVELVSRVGDNVRIRYEGAEYEIPISATDLGASTSSRKR